MSMVYVLTATDPLEGRIVEGVYTDEEQANSYKDKLQLRAPKLIDEFFPVKYEVKEMMVDKPPKGMTFG